VKTSGSATSEEGTYRCEIESDFSRFEMRSSSSGGVWHVYDKSGAVTVLGETTDARVYRPDNMNKTCIWNFSRAYDLNGNYMTASYDTSDYAEHHIPYIKEIRYTETIPRARPRVSSCGSIKKTGMTRTCRRARDSSCG
jgi:hypothetical protein